MIDKLNWGKSRFTEEFAASVEDTDAKDVIFEFGGLACSDKPLRPDDIGSQVKAALAAMKAGPIAVKKRMFLPFWNLSPRWALVQGFSTIGISKAVRGCGRSIIPR